MNWYQRIVNPSLVRKSIADAQWLLLGSVLVMFAFCWLRVWTVSLLPMDRFQTIVEQFREFERFVPVSFDQLFTEAGRIALTYDMLLVVMCATVWAIARGSDSVSGELSRGTMEMLLAQPVSRLRILSTQAAVTVLGSALLALASWLGVYVGIHTNTVQVPVEQPPWPAPLSALNLVAPLVESPTVPVPMSARVDANLLWPATVNLFALGVFLAGLSTLVSALDRYRWRTIGIVATIYVVQLIAKIAGLASEKLAWLLNFTFFTAYEPQRFVNVAVRHPEQTWSVIRAGEQGQGFELGPLGYNLLLIGLGLVAYVAAAVVFARRDLPAPV